MKAHILTALVAAIGLTSVGAVASTNAAAHGPKLVCDQPVYDFGSVDNSQDVEHSFVLKNEGDLTLEIKNVRTSCGCTVADISEKMVKPGTETTVKTKLSLKGRNGAQHKNITVESNDPKQPSFILTLQGAAVMELQVRPVQVLFGNLAAGSVATGSVEVIASSTNPVNVLEASCNSSNIEARIETVEAGKSYRVVVVTKPPLPKGTVRGTLHIVTDYQRNPDYDIPVSGLVVSDVIVAPPEIIMQEKTNGEPVTRYLVVRAAQSVEFQVLGVEPPTPDIQCRIMKLPPNGYRIDLVNLVASPELNGKNLKITTDLESMKEIVVPFKILKP